MVEELFSSSISGENPGRMTFPSPTAPVGSAEMASSMSEHTSGNGSNRSWSQASFGPSTNSLRLGNADKPSLRAINSLGATVPETMRPTIRSKSETLARDEIEVARFRPSE